MDQEEHGRVDQEEHDIVDQEEHGRVLKNMVVWTRKNMVEWTRKNMIEEEQATVDIYVNGEQLWQNHKLFNILTQLLFPSGYPI